MPKRNEMKSHKHGVNTDIIIVLHKQTKNTMRKKMPNEMLKMIISTT